MQSIYSALIVSLSLFTSSFSYAQDGSSNKALPEPGCYQFAANTLIDLLISQAYETYISNQQFMLTSFGAFQKLSKNQHERILDELIKDIDPSFLKLDESIITKPEAQQARFDGYLADMKSFVSHIAGMENGHGSVTYEYLDALVSTHCAFLSILLTPTQAKNEQTNPDFVKKIRNITASAQSRIYVGLIIDFNSENNVIKIDRKKFPMLTSMFSRKAEIYKKPLLKDDGAIDLATNKAVTDPLSEKQNTDRNNSDERTKFLENEMLYLYLENWMLRKKLKDNNLYVDQLEKSDLSREYERYLNLQEFLRYEDQENDQEQKESFDEFAD